MSVNRAFSIALSIVNLPWMEDPMSTPASGRFFLADNGPEVEHQWMTASVNWHAWPIGFKLAE